MPSGALHVVSLGACTPVGRDAWSSAAAVRAGISGFAEHPYMIDTAGEPMRAAIAPWLEVDCQGVDRFEALLMPAIEQALALETDARPPLRIGLAVALPPARPGRPGDLESELRARLVARFGRRLAGIAVLPVGHAGGFVGIEAAWRKIAADGFDGCVIAGVESYLAPESLEWLEAQEQLHGAGPLNNAWGFIPGEAAGAVLLVSDAAARRLRVTPFATVLSVGTATEEKRIKTQTVCIGEGLTAAFRAGLAGLPAGAQVTDVFCDMNGEPYRADEFGFAALRVKDCFVSASGFVAPADCWGDVSAASMPLHMILAVAAGQKGYANGSLAFLWASSEGGERGASLVQVPVQER
jgi:3-oxoacyl-[acyl-carrier-protein] synthase-1